ncbi:MAG: cysteine synthase family protein, partial [Saccharofermentans sp.]|nr:cysteine synthase family protein [Saccharofermentans sp.]
MIYNNILEAVGNTPLIKLNHIVPEGAADVFVKNEGLDVGGSIKTRTALNMIERAEQEGKLNKDSIIVEPTSGNQGIGLALIGAVKGYRTIIVMPDSVSRERSLLVKHYGAEVILIHDDGDIGKAIDECRLKAEEIAASDPNVFIPQQFENPANTEAQYDYTAKEILEAMEGRTIDGFCSGIGTGGTITGIGHALKEANPSTVIWAAEPENAAILSGGSIGTHVQMGIGDGLIPGILDTNVYDDICIITDEEAINT